MFRALLRAVLLIVVLVGVGGFLLGWWGSRAGGMDEPGAVGTTGVEAPRPDRPVVDAKKAREVGATVGEKTAVAADQARRALSDGSVTAKIKAKMALDDTVKALDIDVDTSGTTVTLTGTVQSEAQKQRVLQLARETAGVKQVVDRVRIVR
jgi:hyperosmotically inducible periplasmic protein